MQSEHKIILITQGVTPVVKPLLESNYNVVGIVYAMPRKKKRTWMKALLVKLLERLYGLIIPTLEKIALSKGISYFEHDATNSHELHEWLKQISPELIVVYSMSHLLKEEVLKLPSLGVINLHPSYLPKYRGPDPWFWQYYHNEAKGGVTVHYVDKGEDTGDIINQKEYIIEKGVRSPQQQAQAINQLGTALLLKSIGEVLSGTAKRKVQPSESPTVRARRLPTSEQASIIEWDKWSIEHCWHVLRGTELWLNAIEQPSGLYKGQRWRVEDYIKTAVPDNFIKGKVYRIDQQSVVYCHEGMIRLSKQWSLKSFILWVLS